MDLKKFGRTLSSLRRRANLSQEELAEKIFVSVQLISRWENGRKKPGQDSVIHLIEVFANALTPTEAQKWVWQAGHEVKVKDLDYSFLDDKSHLSPTDLPRPLQHPPLPEGYINRRVLESAIIAALPPKTSRKAVVLLGPGGAGKSTLAAWAAETLSDYFPDGVIWTPYRDVLRAQQWIAQSFQARLSGATAAERARELRSLLRQKACLLVLDDVWNDSPDLIHLNVHNNQCPMVITTRDKIAVHIFGASLPVEVGGLTSGEGRDLLESLTGAVWKADDLDRLAARVDYLPLALTLMAAQLQFGYTPDELLTALDVEDGNLDILDISPTQTRYTSLSRCFDLSYEHLSDDLRQRFAQSGCFSGRFTLKEAAAMWGSDLRQARQILSQLVRLMLLNQDGSGYSLHPLLRDYARSRLQKDWVELFSTTCKRHAAYFIRRALYHPQILNKTLRPFAHAQDRLRSEQALTQASELEQSWDEITAGVNWAVKNNPRLAAQAALLAHTERGALLESVGSSLMQAIKAHLLETVAQTEQAVWHEVLGDLHLLRDDGEAGLRHFKQASQLWKVQEKDMAASRAQLRAAGAYLLLQDWDSAAEAAWQAQALFQPRGPLKSEDAAEAEQLFYWFNMIYGPLARWRKLPEADLASLTHLAKQTGQPTLEARSLNVYQLWCTARQILHPAAIRQKGAELALQAWKLWRAGGRKDRADDEVSFARYRLRNRYSRYTAIRFARRRSATTPDISSSQLELLKEGHRGMYWWLGASEKQRIDWLSWMLPRYLGADDRPRHPSPKMKARLSALRPDSRAYRWVSDILNIGMLGSGGRRMMLQRQPPDDHILTGPEWRVLSGQRGMPLVGVEVRALVDGYLAELEALIEL